MNKKELGKAAAELLLREYPDAACSLDYTQEHELLIAGRLSAQCTDRRVNIVTKELFAKYRSVEEFAKAEISDIERIIKPCGLFKTKAKSIVEMSSQLLENFSGRLPDTIEELTTLSGIGRKTANLIIGDIFHKPAIVADTHCIRISNRLGLVSETNPTKVEESLKKLIPPEISSAFCHCVVLHGREVCKARGERCEDCCLNRICKTGKKKAGIVLM